MARAAPTGKLLAKTDAISLLKADHRTVEELFERFESAKGASSKQKIANQICLELTVHATIEEEIFYPEVRSGVEEDDLDEAYVEHDGAKVLISEIASGSPDEEFYDAKVKVLSELIKHHVKEEEGRDGIFAQAKKSDVDLDEMGERLLARKKELTASLDKNALPPPETRSLNGPKLKIGAPIA